jgi:hypothetical protein
MFFIVTASRAEKEMPAQPGRLLTPASRGRITYLHALDVEVVAEPLSNNRLVEDVEKRVVFSSPGWRSENVRDFHKGIRFMRTVKYCLLATLTLGIVGLGLYQAREDDKPKYTIKEVMDTAHKGDDALLTKVVKGDASAGEKKELLELYTALSQNKPPKGDIDVWKGKTKAIVKAAKEIVDGNEDGVKDLKKATNCKACHTEFRPKK